MKLISTCFNFVSNCRVFVACWVLIFTSSSLFAQVNATCFSPVPDNCTIACNLGTLPTPAACTSDTSYGAIDTFACTNVGALGNTVAITNCASPASYVWYTFKATGTQLVLNILSLTISTPYVGLFKGNNCNNLENLNCFTGAGGTLTAVYNSLTPDSTYYLQISGGTVQDVGNFAMSLQNNIICTNCVQAENLQASPVPVNGSYTPGQTVSFCFTIISYNQAANGWLHGVTLSLGPGWDSTSLTATSIPVSCSATTGAHWGYYPSDTAKVTGAVYGPGFYYETSLDGGPPNCSCLDNDPGDNYGDGSIGTNGCMVTFCWQVTTNTTCATGTDLSMKVQTTDDYQSGAWTMPGCLTDPGVMAEAALQCCAPPVMSVINPTCGVNNGSAIAMAGGVAPWQYNWSNAAGAIVINVANISTADTTGGLAAGQYFVTTTDANNCTNTGVADVGGSTATTATANNTGPYCSGQSVLLLLTTNATTYSWSGPNGFASALQNPIIPNSTAAMSGAYSVTVTSTNGCTATASTTIVVNASPTASITPANPIVCPGASVNLTALGGISYSWSNGGTHNNITVAPLTSTTYYVTITDGNACTATASSEVIDSIQFTVDQTITDITCNGANNGSIVLNTTGTTGPFVYTWNNGSTASSITNLSTGIDTVTVSDVNNCSVVQYDTVTQPTALVLGLPAISDIGCSGGNTGSITANPSGGTPPYTYAWLEQSNNMTFTGQTISGLAADNYGLVVTDSKGCTAVAAYTITSIPLLAFTPSSTNVTCAGYANGTALVTLTSGTPPFEYEWSSGNGVPDDSTMTGIAPGGVSVVVTDANNCSGYAGFTITEPQQIYVADTSLGNNVSCFGGSNGRIVVYAYGGTGTLFPLWSNGPGGYTDSNLVAGIYSVTVTDSNLCTAALTDTVTQPAAIVVVLNPLAALCYGGADGYAWAVTAGGVAPYTYTWSNSDMVDTASGLSANGSPYYCTVTDANFCTATATVSVGQPTELYINPTATAVKCAGQKNGTIAVMDTGGIPPYNYSATTDGANFIYATDSLIEGVDTGWYTVLVSDSNGCTKETQVYVPNAIPDNDSVVTDSTLCYGPGYNDGAIIVTETVGFNQPYEYSLDLGIYQDYGSFYGVSAGNHTVYVINGNQCEDTIPVVVYQPLPVVAEVIPDTVIVEPGQNKQVQVSELNAPNPSYSWTPALGLSCIDCPNPVVNTYTAGMYTVTVSTVNDSAVCYGSATLWVELVAHPQVFIPDAFSPNGDGNNDMFMIYGDNIKTLDLRVFNRWGELVFESENQYNGWDGSYKGHLQSPGVFVYEASITFLDNSQTQKSGTVTLVR